MLHTTEYLVGIQFFRGMACSYLLFNVSSLGKLKADTKFPPAFRVLAMHAAQSKVVLTLK
jgi:hypothetical protein